MILEKVICNIFEIGTLKNLHFATNVAVLTEAFVNVWTKFVLAVVIFIKWRILILEKVICNIFDISTLKNLHFDTNVAVLTEAFVNVWKTFVLADVI